MIGIAAYGAIVGGLFVAIWRYPAVMQEKTATSLPGDSAHLKTLLP